MVLESLFRSSPVDPLQWTLFSGPSLGTLLPHTFSSGPSSTDLLPQTFSNGPSPTDLLRWTFFQQFFRQSTCRPSFSHINSPCSQFQRYILWLCLTPVTSTRRVVNSDYFSNNPKSTHRIKYMSNKFDALG